MIDSVKIRTRRTILLTVTLLFTGTIFSQTNAPSPTISSSPQPSEPAHPLSLDDAIQLSLKQASNFKGAQLNEQLAAEDIKQARAAFLPKIDSKPNYIYTSPSLGPGRSRLPSFLGANAINEIQGLVVASGEIDTSGKLSATLRRNQALLASAHAGTEVARRDLIQGVSDAYFNLALATAKRRAAETNLGVAEEFENNTKLQLDAGEVPPVDLVRARLQTAARRDELEQSRSEESVSEDGLRVLIGYPFIEPVSAQDLLTEMPVDNEIETFAEAMISTRPEFAQFEADRKAAQEAINLARAERRPQLTYSFGHGLITDSLAPTHLRDSVGTQLNVGVTVPIFDWGSARSRETQARLHMQMTENTRAIVERQFAQAFFTARTEAISSRTRIRQIAAAITDAEANVAASLARYRAGEGPISEVIDAQNTLVTQRTALNQAIFDYQTARSRLMRAAGR